MPNLPRFPHGGALSEKQGPQQTLNPLSLGEDGARKEGKPAEQGRDGMTPKAKATTSTELGSGKG